MAVDPRLSLDDKKRLRQQGTLRRPEFLLPGYNTNDIARREGLVGLTRAAGNTAGAVGSKVAGFVGDVANTTLYGEEGPQAARDIPAPPPPQDDAALHVPGPEQVRDQRLAGYADTIRQDPNKFGLTRIFKSKDANGNSVYSNVGTQPAGAEVRYYNQYGNREGMDQTGQNVNAAFDPGKTDIGLLVAAGHGRKSLAYADRSQAQVAANQSQAVLDSLPPEQRAALLRTQMTESGANSRASADRGLRRELAQDTNAIAGRNADINAARYSFDQDQSLAKLERDNPQAAVQQYIGALPVNPQQRAKILQNPNDPRTTRIMRLVLQQAQAGGADQNASLGQFTKTGGLSRFFGAGNFKDNSNFLGGNSFDIPGLSDEETQQLINGYLSQSAGQ
jgi:hypothetical protein